MSFFSLTIQNHNTINNLSFFSLASTVKLADTICIEVAACVSNIMSAWFTLAVALAVALAVRTLVVDRLAGSFPVHRCTAAADTPTGVPPCNKTILLTGCSSGLGRHAAFVLAENGYVVLATVRKPTDADSLRNELAVRRRGHAGGAAAIRDVIPLTMDVTDDASVAAAAETTRALLAERSLALAGVVNNAGVLVAKHVLDATVEDYQWNFDVNVFGVVRVTRTFLPLVLKQTGAGGRLVNIGSVAGKIAGNEQPYSATKHALEAMSDAWRRELQGKRVSVSLVEPGFVASKMCADAKCETSGLDEVSGAILHAVSAPYPKTRYPVASVIVMPSWVATWLVSVLPDRVIDMVLETVAHAVGEDY